VGEEGEEKQTREFGANKQRTGIYACWQKRPGLNVEVKDLSNRFHLDSILNFPYLNFILQKCIFYIAKKNGNLNMTHIDETTQRF
jgi:hypothetical protein